MPPGSAGNSISITTGPVPDFLKLLAEDPFYLQNVENLTGAHTSTLARTAEDRFRDEDLFRMDNALAERSNKQRERYLREFAASRGMVSSGQLGADQAERMFQFLNQQEQKQTQQNSDLAGFDRIKIDADLAFARGKGDAAFAVYERLRNEGKLNAPGKMAIWDEESQLYVTQDGEYYDAYGTKTNWTRPTAALPPGVGDPTAPWGPPAAQPPGENPHLGPWNDWGYNPNPAPIWDPIGSGNQRNYAQ